jgi:hypothetical protein
MVVDILGEKYLVVNKRMKPATADNNAMHSDGQGRGVLSCLLFFMFTCHLQRPIFPAHW